MPEVVGSIPTLFTMPAFKPVQKPKSKQSKLVLEFQRQEGPYPRAVFLENGMRVADLTFNGMNSSMKRIVDLIRDAGVEVTTDDYSPIAGEK